MYVYLLKICILRKTKKFIRKKFYLFSTTCFISNPSFLIIPCHTIVDNGTLRTFTNTSLHNTEYDIKREIIAAKKIDGYFYRTTNHDSHKRGPIVRLHPTHETYVIAQNKSPTFQPFLLRSSTAFFLHIYFPSTVNCNHGVFFSLRSYTEIKRDKIGGGGGTHARRECRIDSIRTR